MNLYTGDIFSLINDNLLTRLLLRGLFGCCRDTDGSGAIHPEDLVIGHILIACAHGSGATCQNPALLGLPGRCKGGGEGL